MMVTTTLAVVALAGALGTGASPSPSWQTDYAHAMADAAAKQKPIAVFIGEGAGRPTKMLADGTIPEAAAKVLRDSYVCLYVDTATGSGKDLAGKFEISEGLIISSPGGNVQALRHTGSVASVDLNRHLSQFATAGQPVTTVVTGLQPAARVIVSGCANGQCNLSYSYPAATYSAPAAGQVVGGTVVYPAGYTVNPFGSSCPNGRCPNAR